MTAWQVEVHGASWRQMSQWIGSLLCMKDTFHSSPFLSLKVVPLWFRAISGSFWMFRLKASLKEVMWACLGAWGGREECSKV